MWEEFFNDLLEIWNFCENANTQPLMGLTILKIENATEALSQMLPIIPREARVVTDILRNI